MIVIITVIITASLQCPVCCRTTCRCLQTADRCHAVPACVCPVTS